MFQNLTQNRGSRNSVTMSLTRQRSPKKNFRKEKEIYDIYSISTSLDLINHLIEIDGCVSMLLESTDTFLSTNSNGLDILLEFMTKFYKSLASSFDDLIDTSNTPYSIGNTSEIYNLILIIKISVRCLQE